MQRRVPSEDRFEPRGSATRKIRNRLLRLEGQVRGIRKMLDEERECTEILVQLAALRQGTNAVAVALFEAHLDQCIQEHREPAEAAEALRGIRCLFQQVLTHG